MFAGRREDLSPVDVASLVKAAGIGPRDPGAPRALRAVIGARFRRTARTHFMPEGATDLPVIATFLGPRLTPDLAPLEGLVHDRLPGRFSLGAADVGYLLGHDRARGYLKDDLAAHPALGGALDDGRRRMAKATRGRRDVYGRWLDAVLRLADPSPGHVPSFMETEAFADARMGSALAAYAQIRHAFVLLAGQGYDAYGCEIPTASSSPPSRPTRR